MKRKAVKFQLEVGTHGNQGRYITRTFFSDGSVTTRRFRQSAPVPVWAEDVKYNQYTALTAFGKIYEVTRYIQY